MNWKSRNEAEYEICEFQVKNVRVPPGFYEKPNNIIQGINYQKIHNKISLIYNKSSKKVRVTLTENAQINFDPWLAESLRFPLGNVGEPLADYSMSFDSSFPANPYGDFKLMYIYNDLVESQIAFEAVAPLLSVIRMKGQDGEIIHGYL